MTVLIARRAPPPIPPTPQRRNVTREGGSWGNSPALRSWQLSNSHGSPRIRTHGHPTPSVSYAHMTALKLPWLYLDTDHLPHNLVSPSPTTCSSRGMPLVAPHAVSSSSHIIACVG
eukprot:1302326-Rhodomonas_salina.2